MDIHPNVLHSAVNIFDRHTRKTMDKDTTSIVYCALAGLAKAYEAVGKQDITSDDRAKANSNFN